MAQKSTAGRRNTLPKSTNAAAGGARRDDAVVGDLRAECERLKAELAKSKAEIAELRARQQDVLNRIDWVLDSLDSLSKGDT